MCHSTPRQELVLPMDASAPSVARRWLRAVGCGPHGGDLLDDAALLVSELVTNAVRHGGPPVVLAVDCDSCGLEVRVRDGSSTLPVPRPAAPDAEDGRGFLLLDILSERWGIEAEVDGVGGKEVWFHLRRGSSPDRPHPNG